MSYAPIDVKRAELRNRLFRRRCMACGFLGAVALPTSSRALADLGEVKPGPRLGWAHKLGTARQMGKLKGSEFDPVMYQDLGLDEGTSHGVMCALGRPEGPQQPTFVLPRRSGSGVMPRDPGPGYVIRDASASDPNPHGLSSLLGKPIAAVQTPIWPLVRPHTCPAFFKYREGLTPAEHVTVREGAILWKRDTVIGFLGLAVGALLNRWIG